MQLELAVSKVDKFGVSPGGDTVEVTERPNGGVSIVLSDGQGSGAPAKAISAFVVSKAISMIADGARDGAVARSVNDALYARRRAQVSATLTIVSADTDHGQIIISRNSNCPVITLSDDGSRSILDDASSPIGTQRMIRPQIVQLPLKEPRTILAFSDGILSGNKGAGEKAVFETIIGLAADALARPAELSRGILDWAIERDQGRPTDDISVVAVRISPRVEEKEVREMTMKFPL